MTADPLLPRPPEGLGRGAALALAVHAALVAALAASVNWHAHAPETVSAELWAALPQIAAPKGALPPPERPTAPAAPAVAPIPAPPVAAPAVERAPVEKPPARQTPDPVPPAPDPQIAIAQAEREAARKEARLRADRQTLADAALKRELKLKQERELELERQDRLQREAKALQAREAQARAKAEAQARAQAQAQREQQADDARLARLREDNLRRMREQIGTPEAGGSPGASGGAARDAAPSAAYGSRLATLIRGAIVYTGSTPDNAAAEVEVRAAAGGTIISRRLVKSSGHKDWDEAVIRALDRIGTLPADADGRVPSTLIVSHRPRD